MLCQKQSPTFMMRTKLEQLKPDFGVMSIAGQVKSYGSRIEEKCWNFICFPLQMSHVANSTDLTSTAH